MNIHWTYIGPSDELGNILRGMGISQNKMKIFLNRNVLTKVIGNKETLSLPLDLLNLNVINPNYSGPAIETLYNDKEFLVLDKPYNIHGHPLLYSENNSCLNFIRSSKDLSDRQVLAVDFPKAERGMLYRLDYETSGVLIFCKQQELFDKIRNNFDQSAKEKIYGALVHGRCEVDQITSWIYYKEEKNSVAKSVVAESQIPKDKPRFRAQIEVVKMHYIPKHDLSFILVKLNQGLRHQIRVQLSMIGHPILGDSLYNGAKATRLFLHAFCYKLHFDGKDKTFISKSFPLFENYFSDVASLEDFCG